MRCYNARWHWDTTLLVLVRPEGNNTKVRAKSNRVCSGNIGRATVQASLAPQILSRAGIVVCAFATECTLQYKLTSEMGGKFFLNFALMAPMLPCARVTCTAKLASLKEPNVHLQTISGVLET